jgi:hypothetical protein
MGLIDGISIQLSQMVLVLALSPLLTGLVRDCPPTLGHGQTASHMIRAASSVDPHREH